VREFFNYVAATFLSSEHQHKRNWPAFFARASLRPGCWLSCARPAARAVGRYGGADDERAQRRSSAVSQRCGKNSMRRRCDACCTGAEASLWDSGLTGADQLMRPNARSFSRILRSLGIPHDRDGFYDLSEYRVARILYRQFDSNQSGQPDVVCTTCRRTRSTCCNCTTSCSRNNLRIQPEYRPCSSASSNFLGRRPTTKACARTPPIPFPIHSFPQAQAVCRNHRRDGPQRIVAMTLADELAGAVDADATQRQTWSTPRSVSGNGSLIRAILAAGTRSNRPRFCAASTFCPTVNASASCSRSSACWDTGTDRTDPTPAGQAVHRRNIHPDRRRNVRAFARTTAAQLQPLFS